MNKRQNDTRSPRESRKRPKAVAKGNDEPASETGSEERAFKEEEEVHRLRYDAFN